MQELTSAIATKTFADLHRFAQAFARREFNLLIVVGRPGIAKSEAIRAVNTMQPPRFQKCKEIPLSRIQYNRAIALPKKMTCRETGKRDEKNVPTNPPVIHSRLPLLGLASNCPGG